MTMTYTTLNFLIFAFLIIISVVLSFSTIGKPLPALSRKLAMMVDPNEGYGPVGSLIRQGPVPFFIRLVKPDTYEAAVNKYMALEKCDRKTAQGNMDAYFQDPNGWASNKLKARKAGGKDLDYANMNTDPTQLVLTAIWSVFILGLFFRIFAVQVLDQ